jgi:hypothetical protein
MRETFLLLRLRVGSNSGTANEVPKIRESGVARLKLHDRLTHVHVTCQPDSYAVPVGPAERESLDALAAIANYSAIGLRY